MAISLGTALKKKKTKTCISLLVQLGFALTESLGCAIGLGIESANPIIGSLILSIAGGTFIYVACSEIITEEFSKKDYKVLKFLMFLLGAAIIIVLWFTDR